MERAPRMGGKRPRKKVCMFCVDRVDVIDYKDIAKLRKCMTDFAEKSYWHLCISSAEADHSNQESKTRCTAAVCKRLSSTSCVR